MGVPPHYDDHAQPLLGHTQCRNQPVPRAQISCAAVCFSVITVILSLGAASLGGTSPVERRILSAQDYRCGLS
jgi:hypothetical protein